MAKTRQFIPKFPDKYAGDARRIISRSDWEYVYMNALDKSPLVAKWISEPRNLNISYVSPLDKRVHQYWPDFLVQYVTGDLELVEIKPSKEALAEDAHSMYDKLMLVKNVAKWEAAARLAKSIGAKFKVLTERQLFGNRINKTTRSTRPAKGPRGTVKPRGTRK